jgi:hypothetical protein
MNDFNSLFPNFLKQCETLHEVLLPSAFVLLAVGMIVSIINGQRSAGAYLRTVARTLVLVILLTQLTD